MIPEFIQDVLSPFIDAHVDWVAQGGVTAEEVFCLQGPGEQVARPHRIAQRIVIIVVGPSLERVLFDAMNEDNPKTSEKVGQEY